ncbi:MAG: hypothetical protein AAGA24_04320 [Pseudomonadota bacterium]
MAAVTPARAGLAICGLVGLFVALWPLGVTGDYMNHLARTHIEGAIWSDETLQQYYALSFSLIPDLTMDLIIPWLSQLTGTYAAGAVTVAMAFLAPPLAGMALAKTVHGRVTWLSLAGFLTVFNVNMDWGFINFAASSGFALLAFVLWIRMQPGPKRAVTFFFLGLFLAINHALAFLLFGFLAAAWQAGLLMRGGKADILAYLRRDAFWDVIAALGGLLFIALATQGADDLPRGTADFFSLEQKAYALSAGFEFHNRAIGIALALIVLFGAGAAVRAGMVRFQPGMGFLSAALLGLVILMPTSVLGIWGLHLRFSNILLIVFCAGITFVPSVSPRLRQAATALILCMGAVSFANGAVAMARTNQDAGEVRQVLKTLPSGARTLTAYSGEIDNYRFAMNAASMAVIDRSAFVPGLFTNTSPVDVQPAFSALHLPQAQPLTQGQLARGKDLALPASENGYWSRAYARGWPHHWDYILYFRRADQPGLDDLPVCRVHTRGAFSLYRVGSCEDARAN